MDCRTRTTMDHPDTKSDRRKKKQVFYYLFLSFFLKGNDSAYRAVVVVGAV